VQGWLDAPGTNFGWLVQGDEVTVGSAKRFDSRENSTVGFRPALEITYTVPAPGTGALAAAGLVLGARRRRR
jgi:MYXO-CTERM domain-containing protein